MMENNDFTNVSVAEVTTWFYTVWLALSGDLERYVTAALEYRRGGTYSVFRGIAQDLASGGKGVSRHGRVA